MVSSHSLFRTDNNDLYHVTQSTSHVTSPPGYYGVEHCPECDVEALGHSGDGGGVQEEGEGGGDGVGVGEEGGGREGGEVVEEEHCLGGTNVDTLQHWRGGEGEGEEERGREGEGKVRREGKRERRDTGKEKLRTLGSAKSSACLSHLSGLLLASCSCWRP